MQTVVLKEGTFNHFSLQRVSTTIVSFKALFSLWGGEQGQLSLLPMKQHFHCSFGTGSCFGSTVSFGTRAQGQKAMHFKELTIMIIS